MKRLIRISFLLASLLIASGCQMLTEKPVAEAPMDSSVWQRFTLDDDQTLIGEAAEVELEEQDSLATIGRHFGLGFDEIVRANPDLDPWMPETGRLARLPMQYILPDAPRRGIVINLSAKRLYYFPKNLPQTVYSYPVGIGRQGWRTPLGATRIVAKKSNPTWTPPASILREHALKGDPLPTVVAAGPDNPLGLFAMHLGIPRYLIHGTNKPYGVGMSISHGCIRLYPEDIAELFPQTPLNTPVRLVDQPYLIARQDDRLYLQAYPRTYKDKARQQQQRKGILKQLKDLEKSARLPLDWKLIESVLTQKQGVPILIAGTPAVQSGAHRLPHPPPGYSDSIPPPLRQDAWRLRLSGTGDESQSRRLAAMLNHQGPPIPAHVVETEESSPAVIAGPFENEKDAVVAAAKIRREFSIDSVKLEPAIATVEDETTSNPMEWFDRLAKKFGAD